MTTTVEKSTTLQSTILRLLANPAAESRLGRGEAYFPVRVQEEYPADKRPGLATINATLWALLGKGILYIDISQPHPDNWRWCLTDAGRAASKDEAFNPDDPDRYIAAIRANIPDVSALVMSYASEAVYCYSAEQYLASAVMLGVASEAAFLELAQASVAWFGTSGAKLQSVLKNPHVPFREKLCEFRKRLHPRNSDLTEEIRDGLSLVLDSVAELLRTNRNDAGHPTGCGISRQDQYVALHMFARYLRRLYDLKHFMM